MTDYIKVKKLNKSYGENLVFKDLNLTFEKAKVNVIMGPSGKGKTTLLRILMGIESEYSGEINGLENLKKSVVFQEDRLCENLSVTANIRLPYGELKGVDKKDIIGKISELLNALGMENLFNKKVNELSGGEKRRVAILRAVLAESEVIFFDEPVRGIDIESRENLMSVIGPLLDGKTVFWVTHNPEDINFFENPKVFNI